MPTRPSPALLAAVVLVAGFTAWITVQAKTLERDLDTNSQKISLVDKPAPDFHLTTLDGHPVSLADYHGKKKLVMVFWASWNNASHPEMLLLSMLYQNAHKPDSDFDVLGVSVDDEKSSAQKFVSDSKIPFPVVWDEGRTVTDTYKIRNVPTALILNMDGKVTYGNAGFTRGAQGEFARQLGLRPEDVRMQMRMPNGRGN